MVDYINSNLFLKDNTITEVLLYDTVSGTTYDNTSIAYEGFELNESISLFDDLSYGSCNACYVRMQMRSSVPSLKDKKITISLILNGDTENPFVVGTYTVRKDELQTNTGVRVVECYDALYDVINTDVADWYNNLYESTNAYTVAELRHSLLEQFGIQEQDVTLVNDNVLCEKTIKPFTMSGYNVLSKICEINGVFAHIGRDNVLRYILLDNSETYEIEPNSYIDLDYAAYSTQKIEGVQIRAEENDIGGSYPANVETDNGLIIEDNFLCYGKSTAELNQIASNVYSVIKDVTYCPLEITAKANLCLEVGDAVSITTSAGNTVTSYVLSRQATGIQTMFDDITASGNEQRESNINSLQNEFLQLKGQSAVLRHTVDGLTSTVTTIEGNYASKSELQQTSDSLTAQIETIQSELDGNIHIYYTNETPTLENYVAWDFTYNIPCNNTVQLRDDLQFEYKEEYYRKHLRDMIYDQTNNLAYRFMKVDDVWGWIEVADSETALILQKITELQLTTDGITAQVAEIQTGYATKQELSSTVSQSAEQITSTVSANYETKSNATATKNNLQSQITQTATELTSKVSTGDVVSTINQSAEQITLNSNRLVVNSTNFKLTKNGDMICSNATITGGSLDIPKKKLTGQTVHTKISSEGVEVNAGQWKTTIGNITIYPTDANYSSNGFKITDGKYPNKYISATVETMDVDGNEISLCSFTCTGLKARAVHTKHYGTRLQNAYETCEPYFGDIGEAIIGEDGICIIPIEPIFAETVTLELGYQVFLQAYGDGKCYVSERNIDHFIVKGTAGLQFGWEIKARQIDYENIRLYEQNA